MMHCKKWSFYFLFLLIYLKIEAIPLDDFHVCTVATHDKNENLSKLIRSCRLHGIKLEILGMNRPWYGNGTKYLYVMEYLNTLQDHEIVLFVDGFDVLILADKKEILDKFLKLKVPFLMSTERNCYPLSERKHEFPPSPTSFAYLNTGGYIGYVGHLKQWFRDLGDIDPCQCDQKQTSLHFLKDDNTKRFYHFDYNCEIFLSLAGVWKEEVNFDKRKQAVFVNETRSFPCVLHANGGGFAIWHIAYDLFIRK